MKLNPLLDVVILCLFCILITWSPFFLWGEVNTFELGLYLPGIDAIFDGQIPYRDFFYLRGPFELYMPVLAMHWFGKHVAILSSYFYFGTVLTLILYVVLARQILTTRLFFYLLIPVLVARTFPRVVFTYWGGMRYALGALTIIAAVRFFKTRQLRWIFGAGMIAALGFWTSIEIGVSAAVGIAAALVLALIYDQANRPRVWKAGGTFCAGWLAVSVPFAMYLSGQAALQPFLESALIVVKNMGMTFPSVDPIPQGIGEILSVMINPAHKNFRHITPIYFYLLFMAYLACNFRFKKVDGHMLSVFVVTGYGVMMYVGAFRNIWAPQMEMALQPEKLLLFYFLERLWSRFNEQKSNLLQIRQMNALSIARDPRTVWQLRLIGLFCLVVVLSSVIFAVRRYDKRFFAFKFLKGVIQGKDTDQLQPLHNEEKVEMDLERLRGMMVPKWQAEDFQKMAEFFEEHTKPQEPVLVYPELGFYYFLIDRPSVGRFPIGTMSWMHERWHREFLSDVQTTSARYAIVPKQLTPNFEESYFTVKGNEEKFNQVWTAIHFRFDRLAAETPSLRIYERSQTP